MPQDLLAFPFDNVPATSNENAMAIMILVSEQFLFKSTTMNKISNT